MSECSHKRMVGIWCWFCWTQIKPEPQESNVKRSEREEKPDSVTEDQDDG